MEETFEPAVPTWVWGATVVVLIILILFRTPVVALIFLKKPVRFGLYAFIVAMAIYILWLIYGD